MKGFQATAILAVMILTASCAGGNSGELKVDWKGTLKMDKMFCNPLLDFAYTADPTAVEYEGRLYVYGTNDQQQCDETHPDSSNSYERIKSLVMMSTCDMVNWTFHGVIPTGKLAPWIIASWAPSICSRVEQDGLTHFYLYFSNSGFGTGVLTSTSPTGPWTSPLGRSIVDAHTEGLGDCTVPFDPGVAIDDDGTGWLTFGAGKARIARLAPDMLSFDSPFAVIPAAHHFEANELNFIGGKMVYTYNLDWKPKADWDRNSETPSACSMAYMIPDDPLDPDSWHYVRHYLRNPGDDGFDYSNNHTHLHKYKGRWYLFYHTMSLKRSRGIKGGYRSICVDCIDVDESRQDIPLIHATYQGVSQISPLNPFGIQEMETTAATVGVRFEPYGDAGNMVAVSDSTGAVMVRGACFDHKPRRLNIQAQGKGRIEVRRDNPEGELIACLDLDCPEMGTVRGRLSKSPHDTCDLVFLFRGDTLLIDSWYFE
ncbi:MAG: family 43 glycosylhydrolase [Bacteroidaceae bacterium]|nr:family 43 glycosylhydrolase [Bacteroidaceae bacterium]